VRELILDFVQITADLKTAVTTNNFSVIPGTIEKYQTLANRVEAALEDKADYKDNQEKKREARKILKKLRGKFETLKSELGEKTPQSVKDFLEDDLRWL